MKKQENFHQQLKTIEKRRWQLWFLAFVLMILFASTIVSLSYWGELLSNAFSKLSDYRTMLEGTILISLLLLVIAFVIYVIEKESTFRRLSRKLIDEKVRASMLDQKVDRVSAILQTGKAVNSVLNSSKVLDSILKAAFSLLGASQGSIMLVNEKTKLLEIVNSYGLNPDVVKKTRIKIGESVAGWVVKNGKPLLLAGDADSKKYKNFILKERAIRSSVVVPLKAKDRVIGVLSLSVGAKSDNTYEQPDLNMAQVFGEQVATALVNSRLYEQTKQSQEKLVLLNSQLAKRNKEFEKANNELKMANKELERFNRLTVNREHQMIKFKKEITRLESKISTEKRKKSKKRSA